MCFSDSNYAGDLFSRKSASGFMFYVLGVDVSWQSKAQESMILHSSDIECVALSEPVKETMFMIPWWRSINISIKLKVTVRVDHVGAILMTSNVVTTSHIKHMDIRYKYVNEYIKNGVVNIIFVKSAENDSNISGQFNEKLLRKMIRKKP